MSMNSSFRLFFVLCTVLSGCTLKEYHVVIVGCPGGPANTINMCRRIYNYIRKMHDIRTTFKIYEICKDKCIEGMYVRQILYVTQI
jgi:hypothetical protein